MRNSSNVSLRPIEDDDLDAIFAQSSDSESIRMAAFTAPNQTGFKLEAVCHAEEAERRQSDGADRS